MVSTLELVLTSIFSPEVLVAMFLAIYKDVDSGASVYYISDTKPANVFHLTSIVLHLQGVFLGLNPT